MNMNPTTPMTSIPIPAAREISIETRMGETAPEYQVRLTIGVQSFTICQPRETMSEASWLVQQFGKALDAASPQAEPAKMKPLTEDEIVRATHSYDAHEDVYKCAAAIHAFAAKNGLQIEGEE